MTILDFKRSHSGALNEFLKTEPGKAFLETLQKIRPSFILHKEQHLLNEHGGCVRGYEQCLSNILLLSSANLPVTEPEANYGVPDRPKAG